jgi:hypothetical protein
VSTNSNPLIPSLENSKTAIGVNRSGWHHPWGPDVSPLEASRHGLRFDWKEERHENWGRTVDAQVQHRRLLRPRESIMIPAATRGVMLVGNCRVAGLTLVLRSGGINRSRACRWTHPREENLHGEGAKAGSTDAKWRPWEDRRGARLSGVGGKNPPGIHPERGPGRLSWESSSPLLAKREPPRMKRAGALTSIRRDTYKPERGCTVLCPTHQASSVFTPKVVNANRHRETIEG